jgi:hypothetical protein
VFVWAAKADSPRKHSRAGTGRGRLGFLFFREFFVARVAPMYPIVGLSGPMGTGYYTTNKWGVDLVQRNTLARSYSQKKRIASGVKCQGFSSADKIYSGWPDSKKDVWRDAVKKPVMSGYTLWMKECLFAWSKGWYAPDVPSISGGYSCRRVVPGHTYPPPE